MTENWLEKVKWDEHGLVPAIAQEASTNDVLTLAWKKGEQSGFVQKVREVRLDCDEDVVLLKVEQGGGIACHTGRHSCFFQKLENGRWVEVEPVLKDPKEIYER